MSALKFSPIDGTRYIRTDVTAQDFRYSHPAAQWRYDPWTGEARVNTQIDRDPFGFSIQPPPLPETEAQGIPPRGSEEKERGMSVFSISPLHGTRIAARYTPTEYRMKFPNDPWRYNPWTGNRRTEMDITSDPQGLLIVPPGEQPMYAALKSAQEILDAQPVPTEDRMLHDGETLRVGEPAQDTITTTLSERGKRYGKFTGHAKITQDLKAVMHGCPKWATLAPDQKEALEMTAHKIGRILNGDPDYDDSWVDIAGYTKLVADRLQGVER